MNILNTISYILGFAVSFIVVFLWKVDRMYKEDRDHFAAEKDREFKHYDKEIKKYTKKKYWLI